MNKEELQKEFEGWFNKKTASLSTNWSLEEIFEWFWKHLEQREANFKASLREEIEKEIKYLSNSSSDIDRGARSGYKSVLQLLDTVKPKVD